MEEFEEWENNSVTSYNQFYELINCPLIPIEEHVTFIGNILQELSNRNKLIKLPYNHFQASKVPGIALTEY